MGGGEGVHHEHFIRKAYFLIEKLKTFPNNKVKTQLKRISCSEVLFLFGNLWLLFKNKEILYFLEKESMECPPKLI